MSQDSSYAPGLLYMLSWLDLFMNQANYLVANSNNQNAIANDGNQDLAVQGGAVVQAEGDEDEFIDVENVSVDENRDASTNDNNLELGRDLEQAALDERMYQEVVVSVREMMGCAVRRKWLNEVVAELEMRSIFQRAKNEKWSVEHANQVCMDYIDLESNQVNRSLLSSRRPSAKRQRIETETDSDDDETESHSNDDDSLDSPKLGGDDNVFDDPSYESDSFNSSGADLEIANVMKREDDKEVHIRVANKRAHDYDEDDEQPKKRAKF